MLTPRDTKHLMIAVGLGASLLFGAAAPVRAITFSTNGGSYSFEFEADGPGRTGSARAIENPTAAYARANRPDAWQRTPSAWTRSSPVAIGTNGGTYYFEH